VEPLRVSSVRRSVDIVSGRRRKKTAHFRSVILNHTLGEFQSQKLTSGMESTLRY
jgi:hypothetical protein